MKYIIQNFIPEPMCLEFGLATETHIKVRVNPDFVVFLWILLTIAAVSVTYRLNRQRIRKMAALSE